MINCPIISRDTSTFFHYFFFLIKSKQIFAPPFMSNFLTCSFFSNDKAMSEKRNSLFRVHAEMLWVREIQNCIYYTHFFLIMYIQIAHAWNAEKIFLFISLSHSFFSCSFRYVCMIVLVYGAIGFYCFYFNNLKWHIFAERLINYSWFFFRLCRSCCIVYRSFPLSLFLFLLLWKEAKKSIIWISGSVKSSHMNETFSFRSL